MDASFCGQLGDQALAAAARHAPPLTTLVLSVCPAISGRGLGALSRLVTLACLDLSYSEIEVRGFGMTLICETSMALAKECAWLRSLAQSNW